MAPARLLRCGLDIAVYLFPADRMLVAEQVFLQLPEAGELICDLRVV